MEKFSKLQALLGEDQVTTPADDDAPWTHFPPKPKHLYEGTDSEDDEDIIKGGGAHAPSEGFWKSADADRLGMPADYQPAEFCDNQVLQLGQLAVEGICLCSWASVKKYPYAFIGIANRSKVAEGFFDKGKVFKRTWDFFYIHRLKSDANQTALLLVPTKQFEAFLATINRTLKTQLTLPSGGASKSFQITFENNGTPQPRYLGRSTSKEMAENLRSAVPPSWYRAAGERGASGTPSDRSLAAFKAKIDLIAQAQKGRKLASKEKQKTERISKKQSWSHITKRVQRYLGLRQASDEKHGAATQTGIVNSGLERGANATAIEAAITRSTDFKPDQLAPYEQEGDIVFICIDVEANERNNKEVTEIGVATLDTRDLKSLVPGERAANWMNKIRARHFRINETKYIVNSQFVSGCPEKFEFGTSEFVNLKDAPRIIASCFTPPFSNPDENASVDENAPKRNIILVGHSVAADIDYLKKIGYNIYNLSNLQEVADTASMWQYLKRDANPRSLGGILAELDIIAWNLHNAGNDAVYTLQAMLRISIEQLYERQKRKEVRDQEKKVRVEESIKEALQNAWEKEEGWSSGGENSDGGCPVAPVAPETKKIVHPAKGSQYREGPWRSPAQDVGLNSQDQRNDGSWGSVASSSSHQASFNDHRQHTLAARVQGAALPGTGSPTSTRTSDPRSFEHVEQTLSVDGSTRPSSTKATSAQTSHNRSGTAPKAFMPKPNPRPIPTVEQKPRLHGPALASSRHTASIPPSNTRWLDIADLVKGTKLVAIESNDTSK